MSRGRGLWDLALRKVTARGLRPNEIHSWGPWRFRSIVNSGTVTQISPITARAKEKNTSQRVQRFTRSHK